MTQQTVSRRRILGLAAGGAALGVAGVGAATVVTGQNASAGVTAEAAIPFEGAHQAGIVTPIQDRLHFVAFDVITRDPAELKALLKEWTETARRLTSGQPVGSGGAVDGLPEAPPDDTGEVQGLPPAGLTLTVGFGPSLFDERFGLSERRPPALDDLPHFIADDLDPAISHGDLCIQACSYDEQVALHAIRQLTRIGAGVVNPRWAQLGYLRTTGVGDSAATPRNLMGFKDGTNNLDVASASDTDDQLWAQPGDGAAWMAGGSYLVSRRIRMTIEVWDRTALREQEVIFGRHKGTGAPLGADAGARRARLRRHRRGRSAGHRPGRARPAGAPFAQRRSPAAAPRLQLRRRPRRAGPDGRRPVLPGLSARPAQPVRPGADPAQPAGRAQRVHQARVVRLVRLPAGGQLGRLLGRHALRLRRLGGREHVRGPERDFVRSFTSA